MAFIFVFDGRNPILFMQYLISKLIKKPPIYDWGPRVLSNSRVFPGILCRRKTRELEETFISRRKSQAIFFGKSRIPSHSSYPKGIRLSSDPKKIRGNIHLPKKSLAIFCGRSRKKKKRNQVSSDSFFFYFLKSSTKREKTLENKKKQKKKPSGPRFLIGAPVFFRHSLFDQMLEDESPPISILFPIPGSFFFLSRGGPAGRRGKRTNVFLEEKKSEIFFPVSPPIPSESEETRRLRRFL